MNELISSLIAFGVGFLLIMLVACILIWFGRILSVITTYTLYCVISIGLMIFVSNVKFDIGYGIYEAIVATCSIIIQPFFMLYNLFANLICEIAKLMNVADVDTIYNALMDGIVSFIIHGVFFILFAIIFRRKKKKKPELSRYYD